MKLEDRKKAFIRYMHQYVFSDMSMTIEKESKKRFGFTYHEKIVEKIREHYYNDFSLKDPCDNENKLFVISGQYGEYRPEGYKSSKLSNISKRIKDLIKTYNQETNNNLEVSTNNNQTFKITGF